MPGALTSLWNVWPEALDVSEFRIDHRYGGGCGRLESEHLSAAYVQDAHDLVVLAQRSKRIFHQPRDDIDSKFREGFRLEVQLHKAAGVTVDGQTQLRVDYDREIVLYVVCARRNGPRKRFLTPPLLVAVHGRGVVVLLLRVRHGGHEIVQRRPRLAGSVDLDDSLTQRSVEVERGLIVRPRFHLSDLPSLGGAGPRDNVDQVCQ